MKHWKKRAMILLMVLSLMMGLAVFAHAAGNEIFVSATGDDTTGDGSEANPYATIVKAYNESASGDTIVLLSDIAQRECVDIWHNLTIKSKDGATYTVTRQAGFMTKSDTSRSWYNPAMFEAHPDIAGTTVTFANIILDDNFLYEGTSFTDQPTAPNDTSENLTRVQDSIIGLYSDPADTYLCRVILEDGCTLQNFGGMSAVNIEGNSELVMKNGSKITNHGTATNGDSGVWVLGGNVIMEQGSVIEELNKPHAINFMPGTGVLNGTIQNNTDQVALRLAGGSEVELGPNGVVQGNTVQNGSIYVFQGSTLRARGTVQNNTAIAGGRSSGIYAINNGANPTVYIEDGAKIQNNTGTDIGAGVLVGNGSRVYMNGGLITGNTNNGNNGSGVNIYGSGTFTMTGGEIKNNTINLGIGTKSQGWALINKGTITGGTTYDYYIESKEQGYMTGGSYLYFSATQLYSGPAVKMQTNDKYILPTTDNTELYLGNASTAARTALETQVTSLGATVLATWFAQVPENSLHVKVAGLPAQTEDVYVISYPVAANGAPDTSATATIYPVTKLGDADNTLDVLTVAGSANGRAYALFVYDTAVAKHTVSYVSNGGSAVPSEAVDDGATANRPLDPTRKLYTFEDWYIDPDLTTVYDFTTPVTDDITLYANWTKNAPVAANVVDLSAESITKNVVKDDSATYDPITFTFELEPYAVHPLNGTLAISDMPAIGPLTVDMLGGMPTASVAFPTDIEFPIGGVYTYKVTEVDGGEPNWTYDDAVFYVDLEIEENTSGDLELNTVVVRKEGGGKDSIVFNNVYNPPVDLIVSKEISNFGENPLNQTKEFTYTITFTAPATAGATPDPITATHSVDGPLTAPVYGTPYTFTLKHNESVVFGNLAAGTTYTVTEAGEEYYTPSVTVTEGGTAKAKQVGTYANELTANGSALDGGANEAAFENEYSITPPTGLSLHFDMVIIIALAALALVGGFILNRKLRKDRR